MIEVEDTKYIYLNSRHSLVNRDSIRSYKSNVIFPFKGLLIDSDDIVYNHIEIINAQIPYSFYNINQYNSELNYFISNPNIVFKLELPYGNYNIIKLSETLSKLFSGNGHNIKITYSSITGRLVWLGDTDFTINTFDSTFSKGSSLYQVLGFSENELYNSTNRILQSPFPANIIPMEKIRICSSILATNSVDSISLNAVNIIAAIPVNSQPFSIIQYENPRGRKSILRNRSIDQIDIQILDQENQFLNFNNNDWSITLCITTLRKITQRQIGKFDDGINPVEDRELINGGAVSVQNPTTFDNDLDYFMYLQGINI